MSDLCIHNVEVKMEKQLPVSERPTYIFNKELWVHPLDALQSISLVKSKKAADMYVIILNFTDNYKS